MSSLRQLGLAQGTGGLGGDAEKIPRPEVSWIIRTGEKGVRDERNCTWLRRDESTRRKKRGKERARESFKKNGSSNNPAYPLEIER